MILVIGGTGYVGRFLVKRLLGQGEPFRCLVRKSSDTSQLARLGVPFVYGDLEEVRSIAAALSGVEEVISLAPIRLAEGFVRTCAGSEVRRAMFLSSTRRFSKVPSRSVDEVIRGEEVVRRCPVDSTVLRPTMIYGPGQDRNMDRLKQYLRKYRVISVPGDGNSLQQPVYVGDVIGAMEAALRSDRTANRSYNIAGACPLTYNEMIDIVADAIGVKVVKVHIPMGVFLVLVKLYGRLRSSPEVMVEQILRLNEDKCFDLRNAAQDFGYRPLCFEEGIRRTLS